LAGSTVGGTVNSLTGGGGGNDDDGGGNNGSENKSINYNIEYQCIKF